jgi:menaquinone-specific isochorismate synthase
MSIYEQEIDRIDFPSYLAEQPIFPKWYQKCRKTGEEIACLGAAETFSCIPRNISSDRLYGAVSFPSAKKDLLWNDFPSCLFFLPQIEIVQSQEKTVKKIRGNPIILTNKTSLLQPIELGSVPVHFPSYETWNRSVESVLESIQRQEIQKLVLARRTSFSRKGDPFSWLSHLLQTSKSSTVFALQTGPFSLFLGATPEHLYQRTQSTINTESIAGTQHRDSALDMLDKEHLEVQYVKLFLENILSSCCESFSSEKTSSIIQTSHLRHLCYKLQGNLKPHIHDQELVSLFHPSPAVGGFPKDRSLEKLCSLELFDRGLYAGAMGWISKEDTSFAVTIRSALIESTFLHAFAGSGIVEGSQAPLEWLELNSKISHWSPICP